MDDIYGVILEQLSYVDMIRMCQSTQHIQSLCSKNNVIRQRLNKVNKIVTSGQRLLQEMKYMDFFLLRIKHPLRYYQALIHQLNMKEEKKDTLIVMTI